MGAEPTYSKGWWDRKRRGKLTDYIANWSRMKLLHASNSVMLIFHLAFRAVISFVLLVVMNGNYVLAESLPHH
jgi:hypothetical protein